MVAVVRENTKMIQKTHSESCSLLSPLPDSPKNLITASSKPPFGLLPKNRQTPCWKGAMEASEVTWAMGRRPCEKPWHRPGSSTCLAGSLSRFYTELSCPVFVRGRCCWAVAREWVESSPAHEDLKVWLTCQWWSPSGLGDALGASAGSVPGWEGHGSFSWILNEKGAFYSFLKESSRRL